MLFAAGKGTRLKPFTDFHPKAMALVNGKSLLERNLLYLKKHGIAEVVINIHHFGQQIIDFLSENHHFGLEIHISDERAALLETGGALMLAKHHFTSDFVVLNADILTDLKLEDMILQHQQKSATVTLAVSKRDSSRQLLFDENLLMKGWQNIATQEVKSENPEPQKLQSLAFSGIHIIHPKLFDEITRKGHFSIMDEYINLMNKINIQGFVHEANLIDVGKPEAIAMAEKLFV